MLKKCCCCLFSVDGARDGDLKRNSNSMICVSSSNSTSLGREGEINGAVGSDQVNVSKLVHVYLGAYQC